jgi:hypothetical protein
VHPEGDEVPQYALEVDRALFDQRNSDFPSEYRGQPRGREFIRILSGYKATIIDDPQEVAVGDIHSKFSGLADQTMGVTNGLNGDPDHGGPGIDYSRPGDDNNIRDCYDKNYNLLKSMKKQLNF